MTADLRTALAKLPTRKANGSWCGGYRGMDQPTFPDPERPGHLRSRDQWHDVLDRDAVLSLVDAVLASAPEPAPALREALTTMLSAWDASIALTKFPDEVDELVIRGMADEVREVLASAPEPAPVAEGLEKALAYALARADLPSKMETAGDYAARLAPLVVESGWLAAASPSPETE